MFYICINKHKEIMTTRKTIIKESTKLTMGHNENMYFMVENVYQINLNGECIFIEKRYSVEDNRQDVSNGRIMRYYRNEFSYRNAIKRWGKKSFGAKSIIY